MVLRELDMGRRGKQAMRAGEVGCGLPLECDGSRDESDMTYSRVLLWRSILDRPWEGGNVDQLTFSA
jgi:hypothetical protein